MITSPLAFLFPEQILLDLKADGEESAIRAIAGVLADRPNVLDAEKLAAEDIERERLSSTSLGCGVAFPHARTSLVRDIVVAAGRSSAGVPFSNGKEIVHFVFVIGTPPDRAAQYLALVGTLARILRAEQNRQKLLAAPTPDDFIATLRAAAGA